MAFFSLLALIHYTSFLLVNFLYNLSFLRQSYLLSHIFLHMVLVSLLLFSLSLALVFFLLILSLFLLLPSLYYYEDTNRRVALAESKGFRFVGAGVSGGEEGALNGASIMPGGSVTAWDEVKPILQSIAARAADGTPCCDWIGPAGSGHFVKMIHNGIEYGDMQLIAEAYWVMKNLLQLNNEDMASVFAHWNEGKLRSYLIEITANILRHKDKAGGYLIDKILDTAGQKGTGKWSVINAMELGMPLGLIATAVFERSLSAQKNLREAASKQFICQRSQVVYNKPELVKDIYSALYASKLVSYAQGFAVLQKASESFGWDLDLASIARMWRGGCIIRSIFQQYVTERSRLTT